MDDIDHEEGGDMVNLIDSYVAGGAGVGEASIRRRGIKVDRKDLIENHFPATEYRAVSPDV